MRRKTMTKVLRWMGKVVAMFLLGVAVMSLLHFIVRRDLEKLLELKTEELARSQIALLLAVRELALYGGSGRRALEIEARWRRMEKDPRFPKVLYEERERIVSFMILALQGIKEGVTRGLAKRYKPDAERTLKDLWEAHKKGRGARRPPPRESDPFLVAAYVMRNFPSKVWKERWPWIEEFSWESQMMARMRRDLAAMASEILLEKLEEELSSPSKEKGRGRHRRR